MDGDNIVFHDGPMHQDQSLCSQHFRTDTVQTPSKSWITVGLNACRHLKREKLPLLKVKIFDGSKPKIIRNESK